MHFSLNIKLVYGSNNQWANINKKKETRPSSNKPTPVVGMVSVDQNNKVGGPHPNPKWVWRPPMVNRLKIKGRSS